MTNTSLRLGSDVLAGVDGIYDFTSLENPAMSLEDPSTWDDLLAGQVSTAGIRVSTKDGLRLAPVWQAVSMIAGDIASMGCNVYLAGEYNEPDWTHWAQPLVAEQANQDDTSYTFWQRLMVHALLWNNGYALINRAGGRGPDFAPIELINLLPDRTSAVYADGRKYYVTEYEREPGKPDVMVIDPRDMIHIHGITTSGVGGCPLVDYARDLWGSALAKTNFAAKFFKNGGRVGGVLELPLATTKTTRDKIEEGFRKVYEGGDNPFKTVILRDNAKFHAAQMSPREAQMDESREQDARDVARHFSIPPSLLGLKDSVSYNSAEQDWIAYRTGPINRWTSAITTQCNVKLLSMAERRRRSHYFEFQYQRLVYADTATLAGLIVQMRSAGVYSPNDGRRALGMPPRTDEGGDSYDNPNTTAGTPQPAQDAPRDRVRDKLCSLVERDRAAVCKRVGNHCRRIAKDPAKLQAWVEAPTHDSDHRDWVSLLAGSTVALAICRGLDEQAGQQQAEAQVSDIVGMVRNRISKYLDPPHKASEIAENVDREMHLLESLNGAWPVYETEVFR